MSVLRNVTKEDTVQYVLAMMVQMLAGEPRTLNPTGIRGVLAAVLGSAKHAPVWR